MDDIILKSLAEQAAEKGESLKAFSGLKLSHVKKQLTLVLAQIGRDGIFDEYTKHDISHIDYMLNSLDWIIPDSTKEKLTHAEWMMITLSIYFHDLGMLVTKDEFRNRANTKFIDFKKQIEDGEFGGEYKNKIFSLNPEESRDRFIYQEFVRKTHAQRIKYWLLNDIPENQKQSLSIVSEVNDLLANIDYMFRRDLALVCESHHLDDLDDFEKYKPNQQYGPDNQEKVNLQYCALILRTADLLHITSDRTPSIEYRLINPRDPISQDEWAKQRAIKTVRPNFAKNSDNVIDRSLPTDTVEVIALFEESKGFFGLISYIQYAGDQLLINYKNNEECKKFHGSELEYPWKRINDSSIETKDFERHQFQFILDQTKILELLVGHTLYNDSTVVLRELIQNSIDATRLNSLIMTEGYYSSSIEVIWNESDRILEVIDNGTGMTLEIIENHLLKVGASRYQDESFKKQHPNFSPISRFGIGLLTCFLIADDIDITTKSNKSEKGILLKIRKVHGKYLLKYISDSELPKQISTSGTSITLKVRSETDLSSIEEDISKWIVFPETKIKLTINDEEKVIGFDSPKQALTHYLNSIGIEVDNKNVKVEEISNNGVSMAYALKYLKYWKEWNLLQPTTEPSKEGIPLIGSCIEGVRVSFESPGLTSKKIFSISNSTGKKAPKTNVARSNIEITPEKNRLLEILYSNYLKIIEEETTDIIRNGFSITWAAQECHRMLDSLVNQSRYSRSYSRYEFESQDIFIQELKKLKCVLIEENKERKFCSLDELIELGYYWTVECASYTSANSLIKEVKSSSTSAISLLNVLYGEEDSNLNHIDVLLCSNWMNSTHKTVLSETFQVDIIKIIPEQRRLDMRWKKSDKRIWKEVLLERDLANIEGKFYLQLEEIDLENVGNQIAINSYSGFYLLKKSKLCEYILNALDKFSTDSNEDINYMSRLVGLIVELFSYSTISRESIDKIIHRRIDREGGEVWERISRDELIEIISTTNFAKYDNTVWQRRR